MRDPPSSLRVKHDILTMYRTSTGKVLWKSADQHPRKEPSKRHSMMRSWLCMHWQPDGSRVTVWSSTMFLSNMDCLRSKNPVIDVIVNLHVVHENPTSLAVYEIPNHLAPTTTSQSKPRDPRSYFLPLLWWGTHFMWTITEAYIALQPRHLPDCITA